MTTKGSLKIWVCDYDSSSQRSPELDGQFFRTPLISVKILNLWSLCITQQRKDIWSTFKFFIYLNSLSHSQLFTMRHRSGGWSLRAVVVKQVSLNKGIVKSYFKPELWVYLFLWSLGARLTLSRPTGSSRRVRSGAWILPTKRPEKAAEALVAAVKLTKLSVA